MIFQKLAVAVAVAIQVVSNLMARLPDRPRPTPTPLPTGQQNIQPPPAGPTIIIDDGPTTTVPPLPTRQPNIPPPHAGPTTTVPPLPTDRLYRAPLPDTHVKDGMWRCIVCSHWQTSNPHVCSKGCDPWDSVAFQFAVCQWYVYSSAVDPPLQCPWQCTIMQRM